MRKAYVFGLLAMLLAIIAPTNGHADTLTVADGTNTNMYAPVSGYFAVSFQHAQIVYPAEMLLDMTGGQLTSLTWYMSTTATSALGLNIVVSLAEVEASTSAANAFNSAPLTQVYSGIFDGTTEHVVLQFDSAYTYSGGNLLVDIYTTNTADDMALTRFYGLATTNASVFTYADAAPNPTSYPEGVSFMPKTTFTYTAGLTCQRPAGITASDVAEESFSLAWPSVEGALQYIVYLDGEEYVTTVDTTAFVSGLNTNTAYTVGVATDCGDGQSPLRSATIRTACSAEGIAAPWSENFDDPGALGCWTIADADSDGFTWTIYDGAAFSYYNEEGAANDWLISPLITFSADDDSMMATWRMREHQYYGLFGTLEVLAAPASAGTDIAAFTDTLQSNSFSSGNTDQWLTREVNLSAYAGQSFRLAFRHSGEDDGIEIDDLTIQSYLVPIVNIVAPAEAVLDQPAEFSATLVRGDLQTMQYTWLSARVGDGDASMEETPDGISITYNAGSADTIVLIGTNAYGTATDTVVVQLLSPYVAPTISIAGSPVVELGDTAQFAAVVVFGSLDGMGYTWTSYMEGQGHASLTQNDSLLSISYDTVGTDTITVVATNAYGPDTAWIVVLVRELNPVTTMPYTCDFENPDENALWQFATYKASTTTRTNGWYIDTAAAANNGGNYGLYISYAGGPDEYAGGELYSYWGAPATVAYAYRGFVSPQGGEYSLQFDWKAYGEGSADFMRVFVVPSSTLLTTSYSQIKASQLPAGYIAADGGSKLNLNYTEWQSADVSFTLPEGGTYMLVFCWRNDGSIKHDPPAAVDNIQLNALSCMHPEGLAVDSTGTDYIAIHWTAGASETGWAVTVGDSTAIVSSTSYVATGLTASSTYVVKVRAICGEGDTSFAVSTVANTLCGPITAFPWTEDFENRTMNQLPYCWTPTVHHTSSTLSYPIIYGNATTAHSGQTYLYNMISASSAGYAITATPTLAAQANTLRGSVWIKAYSYFYQADYSQSYEAMQVEVGVIANPDNEETFVPIFDTTLNTYGDGWKLINFTAEACGVEDFAALAFRATPGPSSTTGYFHIDDLTVYNDGTPVIPVVEPCDAPSGLHTVNTTTNVLVIDWTPAGDEESWELQRDGVVVAVAAHPYVVSGLQPETDYAFSVRAICPDGNGGLWSDTVVISTLPEEVPVCNRPTNLHSTGSTENTITLDWTPGGNETAWQLERDGQIADVGSHPYTVSDLEPATSYTFRLRAVCGDGFYSDWTTALSFSTADTTAPGPGPGPEPGDTTAIADAYGIAFGLYPNPASSSVTVQAPAGTRIDIVDQSGRSVYNAVSQSAKHEINVGSLTRGAYFVRVVGPQGTAVRKLVLR